MNTLFNLIVVVQVLSALIIIGLVLLQHGKGADMGAAFGSGASGSLFGATGSSNFMSKSTGVAAAVFFASTLALAYFGTQRGPAVGTGVMERAAAVKPTTGSGAVPATTTVAPAPVLPVTGSAAVPTTAAPAALPVPAAPATPGSSVPK
ncbi:preprotein translocase subunit SecG [Massilia sp. PWRC2]|uniref:preprotein translocase subunit SecG n=1 Tax=Massilia sp. PWRC2 TaxID=2804626 RepID=UPI003CF2BA32